MQEVIAAITTAPWSSSKLEPSSALTVIAADAVSTATRTGVSSSFELGCAPGVVSAGGSEAGNELATALSSEPSG